MKTDAEEKVQHVFFLTVSKTLCLKGSEAFAVSWLTLILQILHKTCCFLAFFIYIYILLYPFCRWLEVLERAVHPITQVKPLELERSK